MDVISSWVCPNTEETDMVSSAAVTKKNFFIVNSFYSLLGYHGRVM